jgi:glycerol transport system ATP-binding protein
VVPGGPPEDDLPPGPLTLGIRPEYISLVAPGSTGSLGASVERVQDVGTYSLVTARIGQHEMKVRLSIDDRIPDVGEHVALNVAGPHTCFYQDEKLVGRAEAAFSS